MTRSKAAQRATRSKAAQIVSAAFNALPGVLGAVCVSVGLGLIYAPLGLISAGVFLLLVDYRRP
ncbi:MAG: hypothetical protein DIU75_016210 [Mycolicibacterium hassiacum]